jgi:hypothetical protein
VCRVCARVQQDQRHRGGECPHPPACHPARAHTHIDARGYKKKGLFQKDGACKKAKLPPLTIIKSNQLIKSHHSLDRERYVSVRVSILMTSPPSMNSGTLTVAPVSSVAGLVPPWFSCGGRRRGCDVGSGQFSLILCALVLKKKQNTRPPVTKNKDAAHRPTPCCP